MLWSSMSRPWTLPPLHTRMTPKKNKNTQPISSPAQKRIHPSQPFHAQAAHKQMNTGKLWRNSSTKCSETTPIQHPCKTIDKSEQTKTLQAPHHHHHKDGESWKTVPFPDLSSLLSLTQWFVCVCVFPPPPRLGKREKNNSTRMQSRLDIRFPIVLQNMEKSWFSSIIESNEDECSALVVETESRENRKEPANKEHEKSSATTHTHTHTEATLVH